MVAPPPLLEGPSDISIVLKARFPAGVLVSCAVGYDLPVRMVIDDTARHIETTAQNERLFCASSILLCDSTCRLLSTIFDCDDLQSIGVDSWISFWPSDQGFS